MTSLGVSFYIQHCTLMLALLDFTLGSRQAQQQTVVFPTVSVTGRVLFPVRLAVAAERCLSALGWWQRGDWVLNLRFSKEGRVDATIHL